jgi:hypothetical protein
MVESAIYRVTQSPLMMADGHIDPMEIHSMLTGAQMPGTYGRVVFDAYRINTPTPTVFVQMMKGGEDPSIVGPPNQATRKYVYPAPTWKERVYTWGLFKDPSVPGAIAIATFCSFVLLAMIITIIVHRDENDTRMLEFSHMAGTCVLFRSCTSRVCTLVHLCLPCELLRLTSVRC